MSLPHHTLRRVLFLALGVGAFAGCATGGALDQSNPRPQATDGVPAPDAETPTEADRITEGVVDVALGSIGTPYQWGGTNANGFDCSGLIQFAYGKFGIRLPRVSSAQIRAGSPVGLDPDLLRPGDILGFYGNDPGRISHVGLYVGADEFIHSSSSGVRISNILHPYWQQHLIAARRVVE